MKDYKVCNFWEWQMKPSTSHNSPEAVIYQDTDLKWKSQMNGGTREGTTVRQIAIFYEKGLAEKLVEFLNKQEEKSE